MGNNKSKSKSESTSQLGQDMWSLEKNKFKQGGFYIDIGSSDGKSLSNTYLMDTKYKWNGICVDPFPSNMEERSCKMIKSVITDDGLPVTFRNAGVLGGIDKYIDMHKDTVKDKSIVTLPSIKIENVLENVPEIIDYISIDTEGSEWEILKNFPFEKYQVNTLTVEHNHNKEKREKIFDLLNKHGFVREENIKTDFDDFYINKKIIDPKYSNCAILWIFLITFFACMIIIIIITVILNSYRK